MRSLSGYNGRCDGRCDIQRRPRLTVHNDTSHSSVALNCIVGLGAGLEEVPGYEYFPVALPSTLKFHFEMKFHKGWPGCSQGLTAANLHVCFRSKRTSVTR